MAITKLALYNKALLHVGQRKLASDSEDRPPRHDLDTVYDLGAADYCLELVQPAFASLTDSLLTPSTSTEHDLDSVHTLPADFINVVGVYSDSKLDQPVTRYIIEDDTLACEFDTIYLRYTTNSRALADWSQSFADVVSIYLAREICAKYAPKKYEELDKLFTDRVEVAVKLEGAKEPDRSVAPPTTLSSTWLPVYNDALILAGLDEITSINDDSDRRSKLDRIVAAGAEEYCLEIIKPVFASVTDKLTSSVAHAEHDLDNVFTLPSDFVTVVGVFSDSKLDQPITRYIIESNKLACEYGTIYLRYTSDGSAVSDWSPSFSKALAAYMARELSLALQPEKYEFLDKLFNDRVSSAIALEGDKEPERSVATTVTLTDHWRHIYNDAFLIMGLDEIVNNNDDSNRRSKLDRLIDLGLVDGLLEDTGWTFALTSTKLTYDSDLDSNWGYEYVFLKPSDMNRIHGLFQDEHMQVPLIHYMDEGDYFYCDLQDIYLQYVDADWNNDPDEWPYFFKRLVAARLAKDAAPSLKKEGADPKRADEEYERRLDKAESNDAISSPPRRIAAGNWLKSRFNPYRGRNDGRP